MIDETIHLADRLAEADIYLEEVGSVEIQTMICGGSSASAIFQHPPARITFAAIELGRHPVLEMACGIHDVAVRGIRRPVHFILYLHPAAGETVELMRQTLDPRMKASDQGWHAHRLDLAAWSGQSVRLEFVTAVDTGATHHAWAGWADPRLHQQISEPETSTTKPPKIVLLITADALRQDVLGCYGHLEIKTPNIDRLAREGLRFSHARTSSTTTLASMVSLLTGAPPSTHGVKSEWGNMPFHLPTLPSLLNAAGWHTAVAASEGDLVASRHGIGRFFSETLPCLGNPAQDGAVTTRQVLKWLETAPDKPVFLWAQYFDTHPPDLPPEPFRSMYYKGDPCAEASAFDTEKICAIRGIESVSDLRRGLAKFQEGHIDTLLKYRLHQTALALRGEFDTTSDLTTHLKAYGPQAWRGGTLDSLAGQLFDEVQQLEEGRIPPSLVRWIEGILPLIEQAEQQILTWLSGVVDFRFPVRQYHGAVSYFDAQIGHLMEGLERQGLADRTMIVLLSPHGESLTEDGVYFHHHVSSECVLRVPLIVRPASWLALPRGSQMDGIADLIDVAPTLLELLGVQGMPEVPGCGASRAEQWRGGVEIPAHDSFSENLHDVMPSMVRWPWKLLRADVDHDNGGAWVWEKGQVTLHDLREKTDPPVNHAEGHPALVQELSRALDDWLAQVRRPRVATCRAMPRPAVSEAPSGKTIPSPDKQSLRKAKNLAAIARRAAQFLSKAEEATKRLYQTKRWKLSNSLRFGKSGLSFPPLDRIFVSWKQWRLEHAALFESTSAEIMPHALWLLRHLPKPHEMEALRRATVGRSVPRFHAILPAGTSAAASLQSQTWAHVSITNDPRAVTEGDDEWFLCCASTDVWEPHALSVLVEWMDRHPSVEIIYSDHDSLGNAGNYHAPAFKTDWAPEAMLATDYIRRAAVVRGSVLRKLPDWHESCAPETFYNLMLHATEHTKGILHVPHVLCHLAAVSPEQRSLDQVAVAAALRRRRIMAEVEPNRIGPGVHISRSLMLREKISIIIPTRNRVDLLSRCIDSLVRVTDYEPYEIVIVDNGSDDPATLRWLADCRHKVVRYNQPFNYSAINNFGVAHSEGPWLLLLNNDTEILHPEWLSEMAQYIQDPGVGAVGAKLLFPDKTIQHAGVTLGICGLAAHTGLGLPGDSRLHHGVFQHVRNVSAVTAACLLTKRSLWDRFGGLDEENLAISFNDTYFCLQLRAAGYRLVYTPHAVLIHHESASRSRSDRPAEVAWFRQKVAAHCSADPFYNPNLEHGRADWEPC